MFDRGDLTPLLTALIAVMLEPYNTLLGRLFKEGRLDREDLRALRSEVRSRMDDLAPLVDQELRKAGWNTWPTGSREALDLDEVRASLERFGHLGKVSDPGTA